MTVSDAGRVRSSLKWVLEEAGLGIEATPDAVHLDLSGLDAAVLVPSRQSALQTTASLLLALDERVSVVAKLPEKQKSQRAIAASGLMFALVQHSASFEHEASRDEAWETLVPASAVARLTSSDSWKRTFTPADSELRDLLLGGGTLGSALSLPDARSWGVYDSDFTAYVNPHELPIGKQLTAISNVASPWISQLLRDEEDLSVDADHVVEAAMELLGHALDNVREHAFDGVSHPLSLVTLGKVVVGRHECFRLQILDNGVGIPSSLAAQRDEPSPSRERATQLVSLAVHGTDEGYQPLLGAGRGQGLPRMRELAAEVEGRLNIATSGPGGSQISISCIGQQPSEPVADLVPVAGTVVTLLVPLLLVESSAPTGPDSETLDL